MLSEPENLSLSAPCHLEVFEGLAAAEPAWRALEADGAVFTPYQRFDWVKALCAARGQTRIVVAAIMAGSKVLALLPLALHTRLGLTMASIPGSDLGNSDFLILAPGAAGRLDAETITAMIAALPGKVPGLDLVSFSNLPPTFAGVGNPLLALPHQPAADHFYIAPIGPGAESRLPKKRRVDIERGCRRLEETFGPVTLKRAATVAEVDAAHAAFLTHRNARFKEMGISNIFAEDYFVRFFRDTAIAGLGQDKPALCFDMLVVGEEIVATAVGTYTGTHYSQYINSNTDGPASKYNLVGLLLFKLLDRLVASGITSLDMGVGDFAYKTAWADETVVYDAMVPLSAKGRLACMSLRALRQAKRTIKQNPALWALARTVRGLRHRLGKSGTAAND